MGWEIVLAGAVTLLSVLMVWVIKTVVMSDTLKLLAELKADLIQKMDAKFMTRNECNLKHDSRDKR